MPGLARTAASVRAGQRRNSRFALTGRWSSGSPPWLMPIYFSYGLPRKTLPVLMPGSKPVDNAFRLKILKQATSPTKVVA